jgi:phytanoyl-CoA hydroxylase
MRAVRQGGGVSAPVDRGRPQDEIRIVTKTEAPLTETSLAAYRRDGYIAFEGVLDGSEVQQARDALATVIHDMHKAALNHSPGVEWEKAVEGTSSNYAGMEIKRNGSPFHMRFEAGVDPLAMGPRDAELAIRVLYGYRDEHPVFNRLVKHPRIISIVESIVGPGALLFQDMALIKPPRIGSEKPWHQDDAYFSYAPLDQIVGVWIALDEARAENGCMHVIPGGHRNTGVKHWHSALDCEIVDGRIDAARSVPLELKPGGALFFSGLLPHRTPVNRSDLRRRALQFHYRGAGTRKLEPVEYDRVFVEQDGTPASCRAARPA